MLRRAGISSIFSILLVACASGPPPEPPPPPPLDPTGTFDFTAEVDGMAVNGVLTIRGSAEEGYRGSLDSDMGPASVSRIVIDGQSMSFYIPDADVGVEVEFSGTEFNGSLSGAMGFGSFYGTKREGG